MNTVLIPLLLQFPANVKLALWDTTGSQLLVIKNEFMQPGEHQLLVCATSLGLPPKTYIYQLEVQSEAGIFCQYKLFSVSHPDQEIATQAGQQATAMNRLNA